MPIIVLGEAYEQKPIDVYLSKIGADMGNQDQKIFERGHALEPHALEALRKKSGLELVVPQTDEERYGKFWFAHPEQPWMFANLDAFVGDPRKEIAEAKSVWAYKYQEIKEQGLSEIYQIQGQAQMAVTGASVNHFSVFSAEYWDCLYFPLERDEEMIEMIIAKGKEFWENHVLRQEPPRDENYVYEAPVMKMKSGEYKDMSDSEAMTKAMEQYVKAHWAHKDAEEAKDAAKVVLAGLMEISEEEAVSVHGKKMTFRPSKSTSMDMKLLVATHPEVKPAKFKVERWSKRPSLTVYVGKRPEADKK